jgi:hypothetical protein
MDYSAGEWASSRGVPSADVLFQIYVRNNSSESQRSPQIEYVESQTGTNTGYLSLGGGWSDIGSGPTPIRPGENRLLATTQEVPAAKLSLRFKADDAIPVIVPLDRTLAID